MKLKKTKFIKRTFFILAFSIFSFNVFYRINFNKSPQYSTVKIHIGDIQRRVNATGKVEAQSLVNVGAQVSGQIKKIYIKLGEFVEKGQLIAEIDSTTQYNEIEINKLKLQSLQAQLKSRKVTREITWNRYQRELKLKTTESTSSKNVEEAIKEYEEAKAGVVELISEISQTRIAINTGQTQLGYTHIRAPLSGTIVSIPVEEGQTLNASQTTPTVVKIADLSLMELNIEIAEGDIVYVKPGMKIEYNILSSPNYVFEAVISLIEPGPVLLTQHTNENNSAQLFGSEQAVYYYAKARVENRKSILRLGMTIQVSIIVENTKNVPLIPSTAIHITPDGRQYVNILLQGGSVLIKFIHTGITDNIMTQILAGIDERDEVILDTKH